MKARTVTAALIGLLHLVFTFAHSFAHQQLGILGSPLHLAFVAGVITLMPMAALAYLRRDALEAMRWLWLALVGSFVFGVYYHFIVISPDHVCHLPADPWTLPFQASAVLLAACDGLGAIILGVMLARASELIPGRRHILLVDGECVFCNRLVAMIMRFDRSGTFHFAHIQGDFARAMLRRLGRDPDDVDPIYLVANAETADEKLLIDGEAGREVWPRLFAIGALVRVMPLPLLNVQYALFARIRYRLFGKYEQCYVPSLDERARYLE